MPIVRINRTMRFIFLIDRRAAAANQFAADLLSALPPKAGMPGWLERTVGAWLQVP
jgi:hypothetical protein